MADADPTPQKTSSSSAGRYLKIGIPLVILVLVFFYLFFPRIEVTIAINGLHAHDARARAANAEKLRTYPDKELVVEMLLDAVQDEDRSFDVRLICARLLLDNFDRVSDLEELLKSGDLSTRAVVLKSLSLKPYFQKTYADDPSYKVRETVTAWLARSGDLTRFHAIQLAVKLKMREHVPAIRKLLARTGAANVHQREERDMIIAAAGAMRSFEICEAVPEIMAAATTDPDSLVRLRFMQIADEMTFRNDRAVPCADAAGEEEMKALVQKALDDADHRVRMGALLILSRRPEWSQGVLERIRELADGEFTGAERRHALDALAAARDPADHERIPLYFHDRDVAVRTTAAVLAREHPALLLEGCLIGLVAAETESDQLFIDTLGALRAIAKKWVGFPSVWGAKAARDPAGFKGDLRTLFSRGEFDGITRDGLAEAWFGWWCDRLGLTEEQKTQALEARRACWKAMDARDPKAAEAALDALGFDVPGLFSYERAWIDSRS